MKNAALHNKKIQKIDQALGNLASHETECHLCPRECGANRKKGRTGFCQSSHLGSLSHALLHLGEEPVLSGYSNCLKEGKHRTPSGSGALFFSGCNLKCLFCQNYQLSWLNQGKTQSDKELAEAMLGLQEKGALNINFVSPTHMILSILKALKIAVREGLNLPLVFNSNGYEKAEVIQELEGIVDIYLPDFKFFSPLVAKRYSGVADYAIYAGPAVKEMFVQQPILVLNEQGIAQKGLIIRHLVLPGHIEDSLSVLEWIAQNLSTSVHLSLMSQYHPVYKAPPDIQRTLSTEEYEKIVEAAEEIGFENAFIQPDAFGSGDHLIPDFSRETPFSWR